MRSPMRLMNQRRLLKRAVGRTMVVTPVRVDVTSPAPAVKPKKRKIAIEQATQDSLMDLPYVANTFKLISCSRQKATALQRWLYTVNKDNAAGRHYATRYNYAKAELIVWRMA